VLYAEPNAFDADLTRRFFAQQAPHIRVEVVGSGDEVLARMPQSPESPPAYDVLLLDYRLPGLNALEVVKALRLEGARQIPIVLVTGQGNEEVAVQALRLGVDEYLVKREGYLQRLSVVLENVQKQAELNQAEARYRNLFASMRDAIIIADNSRTIIDANQPALRTLFGYETEEILGQSTAMLYADPDQFELLGREVFHHQAAETGKLLETRFRRKSGDVFHGEVSALQLRDDKGIRVGNIGVIRDITERKCHEEQLKHLATHDELTGLANRALLLDRLEQSLHYARRSGRLVAVLLLDLDRFKVINDSLGHGFGDTLLGAVAQRLRQMVREADTVARLGGDEFVILLAEVAEVDDVGLVAAKILRLLAEPHRLDEREITLTASLGVSLFPRDSDDGATLIRNADMAMYRAKRDGRSAFAFYSPEMNRRIRETLELEGALRQALERDEFRLHYQPKVGLASGRVIGCEALVRWHHPQRGMVSPADFIPLAEETGLIVPLGTWVLQEACRQARVWQDAGLPALNIAVNLSARQFRKGNLPQLVEEFLRQAGLDPRLLELELTESMVMDDPVGAQRTMHALKELGVGLSLDDFGTGYSSLNYLRRFPVDSLKIDRSFIRDVASDPSGASVVTSVIDIAHNLGLTAVAEGVETREQLVFLAGCGCDMLQGFLFSKPLPAEEFADLLREGRRLTVAK
jgi:diguanylate cyclase (GGDEF)-like protein/PAS domain S-box-containing protein